MNVQLPILSIFLDTLYQVTMTMTTPNTRNWDVGHELLTNTWIKIPYIWEQVSVFHTSDLQYKNTTFKLILKLI
jgi:hypothetical protein